MESAATRLNALEGNNVRKREKKKERIFFVLKKKKKKNDDKWDVKRVRQWLLNRKEGMRQLGSSTGSLKRPVVIPEERVSKRSHSFSSSMAPAPGSGTHPLSNFFSLEHTRLPKDPLDIFHLVGGEELASQLSFNWLLEERIANSCDVLERVRNGNALESFTSGIGHVMRSRINPSAPFPESLLATSGGAAPVPVATVVPYVPPTDIINPQPPALQVPPDDCFALLFGASDNNQRWEGGGGLFTGGTGGDQSPMSAQLRDLIHPEPLANESDSGELEPMSMSDVGPEAAVREGTCSLVHSPISFIMAAAEMTPQGQLVVVSRRAEQSQGASLRVARIERDALTLQEASLPMQWIEGSEAINAMALDSSRSTIWIASGNSVIGYAVDGTNRGPTHRLSANVETSSSSLLLRGSKLCLSSGGVVFGWDVDDFEGSSEFSSVMDHESVSSLSDCEGSPPMYHGSLSSFSKSLHAAISKEFCRICGGSLSASGGGKRDCSECHTVVCVNCAHVYKLTSLGEKDTRLICNACIPSIRKRILSKQNAARPQQQQQLQQQQAEKRLSHRRSWDPHLRQQVVKPGTEHRAIGMLRADFSAPDRLFMSFQGRQCGLAWSLEQQRELRWYVGHSSSITAFASCEESPQVLATGSRDTSTKIWDVRVRAPVFSLEGHKRAVTALCLANMRSGAQFCFSGGADEVVKVWDLRKNKALYELSTGNNCPNHLFWHTSSLVCAASSSHLGALDDWPVAAFHPPAHFPRKFNCGTHSVLQYDFVSLV